jgi:hypothetical protein
MKWRQLALLRFFSQTDCSYDLIDHRLHMEIIGRSNADVSTRLLDGAGDNRSDGGDCRAPKSFLQYCFAQALLSHPPQALDLW